MKQIRQRFIWKVSRHIRRKQVTALIHNIIDWNNDEVPECLPIMTVPDWLMLIPVHKTRRNRAYFAFDVGETKKGPHVLGIVNVKGEWRD